MRRLFDERWFLGAVLAGVLLAGTAARGAAPGPAEATAAVPPHSNAQPPAPSQILAQAYALYRANPNPAAYAEVLHAFKQVLVTAGPKVPAASLIKANPALLDLGVKAIDAGNGRIFVFTRAPDPREVIMQWADTKATVSYVGRRHRIRKVSYTTSWHVGSLVLPPMVVLTEARILGSEEGKHSVVLVGSNQGSALWLRMYHQHEGSWQQSASQLDSIPSFLINNVSGKVAFRGPDLIFSVARVVPAKEEGATTNLPEAESATYKFWLHLSDNGYVLMPNLPDEAQFATVRQLIDAVAGSRTDVARSLVADAHLLSILRYVGLRPSPAFHVVQMASPPSGAPRFRVVTGGKDDVIFEVTHVKGCPLIRAIFIAPPDPFLQEIVQQLPSYDRVAAAPPPEQQKPEKHQAQCR